MTRLWPYLMMAGALWACSLETHHADEVDWDHMHYTDTATEHAAAHSDDPDINAIWRGGKGR